MLSRKFTYSNDSEFGSGFCPAWMDNGDPVQGFGAAHDTLEHFPRCIGGFEGEMMAFGAMHVVRGMNTGHRFGHMGQTIYSAQESDIGYFLRNVGQGRQTIKDPGIVRCTSNGYDYCEDEMLIHIRKGMMDYIKEDSNDRDTNASARADALRGLPRNADKRILGWITKGYEKAKKRYAQWELQGWQLSELFTEIESQFDKSAKRTEGELGDTVKIMVDFGKREVRSVFIPAYGLH